MTDSKPTPEQLQKNFMNSVERMLSVETDEVEFNITRLPPVTAKIRIDRYAVVKCEGGFDLWDCLNRKRIYNKPVVDNLEDAIDLCNDLIETTGERKSVWVTVTS